MWVSGSYIRHQGQSLKRQVNLQTDIRGRGFSYTGRAKRAGAAAPQPPHLSYLNGTDSSDSSAKAASLLRSLHTLIFTSKRVNSSAWGPDAWVDYGVSTSSHKGLYVCTSKPQESMLQQPVNCFMVLAICPCAFIFMALKIITSFIKA